MLQLNQSRIIASTERKLATGVQLAEEGVALVATYENNELRAKPSTGVANEVFLGLALSAVASTTVVPMVEELTIPTSAPYTVELQASPVTDGEIFIKEFTKNSTADATKKYALAGNVLTFNEADKGVKVRVVYAYSPTIAQLTGLQGEQAPGQHVTTALNQTGIITAGEVFTSAYDVTADWTPTETGKLDVYLGANGKLTTKTSGTKLNAIVTHVPQVGSPFLGLQFHI